MAPESSPVQRVRDAVEPAVADVGLLVEDVVVTQAGTRSVVRVVVDLPDGPGGVDADALADASRAVSAALDAADPVAGSVRARGLDARHRAAADRRRGTSAAR